MKWARRGIRAAGFAVAVATIVCGAAALLSCGNGDPPVVPLPQSTVQSAASVWVEMPKEGAPEDRGGVTPAASIPPAWDAESRRLFVWGGNSNPDSSYGNGAVYDAWRNAWTPISSVGAPSARCYGCSVWDNIHRRLILWGGARRFNEAAANDYYSDGAVYDPETDTWESRPNLNSGVGAPVGRVWHSAVWTGKYLFVYGGYNPFSPTSDGGLYDPETDTWTLIDPQGAPGIPAEALGARCLAPCVWTGTEVMLAFGSPSNFGNSAYHNDGLRFDPYSGTWGYIPSAPLPPRDSISGVWTGEKFICWGGYNPVGNDSVLPPAPAVEGRGASFSPATNQWTLLSTAGEPTARQNHTGVWTGSRMIIWAGQGTAGSYSDGALYDPETDSWEPISATNVGSPRTEHLSVWDARGRQLLVWGGFDNTVAKGIGGRMYRP